MVSAVRQRPWGSFQRHVYPETAAVGEASEVIDIEESRCELRRTIHLVFIHSLAILYIFGPWPRSTAIYFARSYILSMVTSDYKLEVLVALGLVFWLSPYVFPEIWDSVLLLLCYGAMASMTAGGVMLFGRNQSPTHFSVETLLWSMIVTEGFLYMKPANFYRRWGW